MIKKKVQILRSIQREPLRRFVYGLLASIENLRVSGMIKPKRINALDCDGCRAFVLADSRAAMPSRCPKCGRPAGEAVREFWLATERKSPPAAGAHTPGFRRAKKS